MNELFLRKLSLNDEKEFCNFVSEQIAHSGAIKGVRIEDGYDFKAFLSKLKEYEDIPFISYEQADYPSYQFVLVRKEDNKIVGAVVVRPRLNKTLFEDYEGNIGYAISPLERGKGYAKIALSLAIEEYKKLNPVSRDVYLCCYKENIGSRKVITGAGGVLVEEIKGVATPQKYLIKL